MAVALSVVAAECRDLLGIFTRAYQIEAEVRLEALLLKVERNELPADQMGQYGTECRIDQGSPDQIAGDCDLRTEQMQRCLAERTHKITTNEQKLTIELSTPVLICRA